MSKNVKLGTLQEGLQYNEDEEIEIHPINLIKREEWGATKPSEPWPMDMPLSSVIMTYTGTEPCKTKEECITTVRRLQKKHKNKGYSDIRYNFLVGSDGNVYEGRGWETVPEKTTNFGKLFGDSICIGIIWRKATHYSREAKNEMDNMHIIAKKMMEKEMRAKPPTPDLFQLVLDVIHHGVKHKYLEWDTNIYNSQ